MFNKHQKEVQSIVKDIDKMQLEFNVLRSNQTTNYKESTKLSINFDAMNKSI